MSRVVIGILLLSSYCLSRAATDNWDQAIGISDRLQLEGKFNEARSALLAVVNDAKTSHTRLARTYNDLGVIAQQQGKYVEAERYYRQAIPEWESIPKHLGTARTMNNLSSVLYLMGKFDRAEEFLRRAEEIQIEAMGPDHPETARLYQNRATMYLRAGKYASAEPPFRRALEIWERNAPTYDLEVGSATRGLAMVCRHTGRASEADLFDARAQIIWERELEKGYASPDIRAALATLYLDKHQPQLAEPILQQAIAESETQRDPDYPFLVPMLKMYAVVCRQEGRKTEAKQIELRAKQLEGACSQLCLANHTVSASDLLAKPHP